MLYEVITVEEGVHDAPDRAEQADERRGGADGGQDAETVAGLAELAVDRGAHRTFGPVDKGGRLTGARCDAAGIRPFPRSRLEDTAGGVPATGARAQVEVFGPAVPEGVLELNRLFARSTQRKQLLASYNFV